MGSYDAVSMFSAQVLPEMTARIQQLRTDHEARLDEYAALLIAYNRHVNLVSRQTVNEARTRHILHSMAFLARSFPDGTHIVDWGTGGGLPAIPIAICAPQARILAVDSINKKIRAVQTMSEELELANLETWAGRAEGYNGSCDYSVSRATAPLATLWQWHRRVRRESTDDSPVGTWAPGLLCLKGGNLEKEIGQFLDSNADVCLDMYSVARLLDQPYFEDKWLIHVYA